MSFFAESYETEIPLVLNQWLTFGEVFVRRVLKAGKQSATHKGDVVDCRQSTPLQIPVTPKLLDQLTSCGVPNLLATRQSLEFPGIGICRTRSESAQTLVYMGLRSFILDDDKFGWRKTSGIKISLLLDIGTVKDYRSGSFFTSDGNGTTYMTSVEDMIQFESVSFNLMMSSTNPHCWTDANSQWKTIISLTLFVTRNGGAALALNRKMLSEENFFDVTLIADDGAQLKFHKGILATHSAVFASMFNADMREAKTGIVEMSGMCEESVRALREYFYAWTFGRALNSPLVSFELLQAGHQYGIDSLVTCMEVLLLRKNSNWYTVDVAWRLFNWAKVAGLEELKLKAVYVLKTRVRELLRLPAYQKCFEEDRGAVNDLMTCFAEV